MPDSPAAREFLRLLQIMSTLRSPDGCPWDREQTIDSLKPFVLEEAYELLEAIDRHDHAAIREELGDHVFEAVFLAQLESEAGHFTIAEALAGVADKLIRRHPHVFGRDAGAPMLRTAGEVRTRWEEIKAAETGAQPKPAAARKGLLDGIPGTLPALLRAFQIGSRAASVGFDWTAAREVIEKIREEVDELADAVGGEAADRSAHGALEGPTDRVEEELGDALFAMANLARKLGVEPETALRKANDKFTRRFAAMEGAIAASGRRMRELTIEELEQEWQRVKRRE